MVCPNCGAENPAKSKWCGKCRYELNKIQRSKKNLILITILLSCYCLLAVPKIISGYKTLTLEFFLYSIDMILGIIFLFIVLSKREKHFIKNIFIAYCSFRFFIEYVIGIGFLLFKTTVPISLYISDIIQGICKFIVIPLLYYIASRAQVVKTAK